MLLKAGRFLGMLMIRCHIPGCVQTEAARASQHTRYSLRHTGILSRPLLLTLGKKIPLLFFLLLLTNGCLKNNVGYLVLKSSCGAHVLCTFQWGCGSLAHKWGKIWIKNLTGRNMELLFLLCHLTSCHSSWVLMLAFMWLRVGWINHWSGEMESCFAVNFQQNQPIDLLCSTNIQELELAYWHTFLPAVSSLDWWKPIMKSHPQLSRCKSQCGHTY